MRALAPEVLLSCPFQLFFRSLFSSAEPPQAPINPYEYLLSLKYQKTQKKDLHVMW